MSDVIPPPPPAVPPTPPPPPPMPGQFGGNTSKNNLGTWALVLGIISVVCCGFLAGVPAIILGLNSKKAQEQGLATNGNLGNIGFILGIIGTVLWVLAGVSGSLNGFVDGFTATQM